MLFKSQDILDFGKHRTFSLAEVYQYDPTYLNWMVEFISEFEIDIEEFYKLPKPTVIEERNLPDDHRTKSFEELFEYFCRPDPNASVGMIKKRSDLQEIDFKFSTKTIDILAQKKEGSYVAPIWQRPVAGKIVLLKDLGIDDKSLQ